MKQIHFINLSPLRTFHPYLYGQMRSFCEQFKDIKDNYAWNEPTFLPDQLKNLQNQIGNPDILAVSCSIWNFGESLRICKEIKKQNKKCLVVLGGVHLSNDSSGFFEKYPFVDIAVHGEGEIAFSKVLLENLKAKPDWTSIPGLSVKISGFTVKTGQGELLEEVNNPSPFKMGFYDSSYRLMKDLGIPLTLIWETNRGCPFGCMFCAGSTTSTGIKKVRMYSMERLKDDISAFGNCNASMMFMCDQNFGMFPRDLDITRMLIEQKEKSGSPGSIRTNFSARSDERVFQLSKELMQAGMLWATEQTVQTLHAKSLDVLNRKGSVENLKKIRLLYERDKVPTFTEILLGAPQETKESFIKGISDLFRLGFHEDIRLYEFFILPNTKIAEKTFQESQGMKTTSIPLSLNMSSGEKSEWPEIVTETETMPFKDWLYCYTFYEMIRAFHNGGYTRFISQFFERENKIKYEVFYQSMLGFFLEKPQSLLGRAFNRIYRLQEEYVRSGKIPNMHKVDTQPDMIAEVRGFLGKRKICFPYRWLWLIVNNGIQSFYGDLFNFVSGHGNLSPGETKVIKDLFQYQKDLMLTPHYDSNTGKKCFYHHNWPEYFFLKEPLKEVSTEALYHDTHMGPADRFPLIKGDLTAFTKAALGIPWPSSMQKQFFHQFEKATIKYGVS